MNRKRRRRMLHAIAAIAGLIGFIVSAVLFREVLGIRISDTMICVTAIAFAALVNAVIFSKWG